jgi:adenosine deaminase
MVALESAATNCGPPNCSKIYAKAGERGLHLTAHAGENAAGVHLGSIESKVERIGHGLTAGRIRN